ncbi:MAG: hypothetical protein ACO1OO_16830 [Flavisolibacter sp.]
MQVFYPSINIERDAGKDLNYIVTPNAMQVFRQIVNDYKLGIRVFNIIGAYGIGKSSFLLALEKNLDGQKQYFSNKHINHLKGFGIYNLVGDNASLYDTFVNNFGLEKNKKTRPKDVFEKLDQYYGSLQKKGKGLLIVIDEFGKYLEHAAQNNPEKELYFIQQLAEYANDDAKEILLVTTLHQDFNAYARELTKLQKNEWDKVKGRLKEVTFNEPVEQLLFLASERLSLLYSGKKVKNFSKLFKCIEKSKAFPLKDYFYEEFAEKLLPFDILSAAILTLSLQRYGQNERSLFSFIHSNDPLGLTNYDTEKNPYYNLSCLYDYLIHNFYSLLSTKYNPDYAKWAAIRTAIERAESTLNEGVSDAVKIIKTIGLLNIFASAGIELNKEFVKGYSMYSLGTEDPDAIIQKLEGLRIIRFVKHQNKFILFQGTDLDIELAINNAGLLVEKVNNVVHHLNQYFDFPYVAAKAIHYERGTPRYFAFELSEVPILKTPEDEIDGYINLIFSDSITEKEITEISTRCNEAIIYGWYKNTNEIKELLFEIDKIRKVKENHSDDRVAIGELDSILQHQVKLLNHYVIGSLFRKGSSLLWFYKGEQIVVTDSKSFNRKLSFICSEVYNKTPVYRNELVNKTKLSGPIQAAKKSILRALAENWDKKDLGFDENRFPPEKTIYLSLLRETGIHRNIKGTYSLGEPTNRDSELHLLWGSCAAFLETTYSGRRNLQELADILRHRPFKLKQGFIDFWLPIFLFAKRDDYALFGKHGYIPFVTHEILELVSKDPGDYEIKAFHIEGIRLNLFNGYRVLLSQSTKNKLTNKIFIDTIRPFLAFYRNLPEYAKNTTKLSKRTLALRRAIAYSKDPEDSFFVQFPKAMGYEMIEIEKNPKLLKQYSDSLQESIKEIRSCYDELVNRVDEFIMNEVLGLATTFPAYRTVLQDRYKHLKKYLLLPYQKSFHHRLYSETEDKKAWLNSIVQACLDKPLEMIIDTEEEILYEKLKDIFHELDNLTDISESGIDIEQEIAFKFEITSFVEGLKKNLVRLPKSKVKQLIQLQSVMKTKLSSDRQLNIATLAKMLEELLTDES